MILFVCLGNTCRSPMAAALARNMGLDAASAGFLAVSYPANLRAVAAMGERGIDLTGHMSRMITKQMVEKASTIVCVMPDYIPAVLQRFPQAEGKLIAIEPGVSDPIEGTIEDYRRAAAEIEAWLKKEKDALTARELQAEA